MPQSRLMHFAMDLSFAHTDLRWRRPEWRQYRLYGPEYYQDMARIAQRGVFDMLFFGDAAETPENHGGDFRSAVSTGFRWPKHDMLPMIATMAAVTYGVGFGLTMSTTYQHPFHVARAYASLDWVTGGRTGWNAVTGAYKNEAANWGLATMPTSAERYKRAREHLQVVTDLWATVDDDAIVMDYDTGLFADPDKVHLLEHHGEYYDVRGPLPAFPSPQGRPVIIQAGQSPDGMDLAATYADMQFVSRQTTPTMAEHRRTLDELLVAKGRSPRDLGVWWALGVMVGESKEAALAQRQRIIEEMGPEHGMMALSAQFGMDFSALHPDTVLSEAAELVKKQNVHWGSFDEIVKTQPPERTIGQYAAERALPRPRVAGTPEEIADQFEELHDATDANGGFIIAPGFEPMKQLTQFVDLVVPELQRRGLMKKEYAGPTLRSNWEA